MSTTPQMIYGQLAAVMADCSHVAKRDRNDHHQFMFRGIDAVVNAVGPVLREHGVIVVPVVDHITYETVATTTGRPVTACRVLADYIFYAADGSSITTRVAGEAYDSGDKATPKAMSVAFRTALLQALALPTDEPDPDASTYERDHAPAPEVDPLVGPKLAVKTAWEKLHGSWDQQAMRRDFEQQLAMNVDTATADDLQAYANYLASTPTIPTDGEDQ